MNRISYKIAELLLLFFSLPIILTFDFNPIIKVAIVLIALGYCVWVTVKLKLITLKSLHQIQLAKHWKTIAISFIAIIILSTSYLYVLHPDNLFVVVKQRPLLWLFILFFYAVFSVYPQEILYRSFFFKRYDGIFKNFNSLLLINIVAFPLAHLFFKNEMVLFVTLIGGILFTLTYRRSKSVLLTSIEHSLYGNWLFTVGMGEMLAFPMPS
jgi:membrane protease YdiL (CAAX protease family)